MVREITGMAKGSQTTWPGEAPPFSVAGKLFCLAVAAMLPACTMVQPDRGVEAALVVPAAGTWEAAILPEDAVRLGNRAATWERALTITAAGNARPDCR